MNAKIALGTAASLFALLILSISFPLLVQSGPVSTYPSLHSPALLLNFQGVSDDDCDEEPPQYIPQVSDEEISLGVPIASGLFDFISWFFIIGIGAVAVFVLYFLVTRLLNSSLYRKAGADSGSLTSQDGDGIIPLPENPLPSAESLASQGDYRSALRVLYRGILGRLVKLGVLDTDRHRTNWEVLRLLQSEGHAQIYQMLVPVTQLFDSAWYGVLPISAQEYNAARDATSRIMQSGERQ